MIYRHLPASTTPPPRKEFSGQGSFGNTRVDKVKVLLETADPLGAPNVWMCTVTVQEGHRKLMMYQAHLGGMEPSAGWVFRGPQLMRYTVNSIGKLWQRDQAALI